MALHLEEWGLARIISTITGTSIYRVNPKAQIHRESRVFQTFTATFIYDKNHSDLDAYTPTSDILVTILAAFDGGRILSDAMTLFPTILQPYAVDIVVWLLRWNMLVEVHSYLFWMDSLDASIDLAAYNNNNNKFGVGQSNGGQGSAGGNRKQSASLSSSSSGNSDGVGVAPMNNDRGEGLVLGQQIKLSQEPKRSSSYNSQLSYMSIPSSGRYSLSDGYEDACSNANNGSFRDKETSVTTLNQPLTIGEISLLDDIRMFLDGTNTLSDVAWEVGVSEAEVSTLVAKLADNIKSFRCIDSSV